MYVKCENCTLWDFKKRRLLVCYRRCVQRIGPIRKGWRVYPETSVRNYNYTLRKSPKSADLIYTAMEAWSHTSLMYAVYCYQNHFVDKFVLLTWNIITHPALRLGYILSLCQITYDLSEWFIVYHHEAKNFLIFYCGRYIYILNSINHFKKISIF
jgi:hypothetical protein